MATLYSQPAAANYYSPSPMHHQKQRGHRVCDQCSAVETSAARFRLCGGCMSTQYCSPECQKLHWQAHKQICQHTASQVSAAKHQQVGSAYGDENIAKCLRKFTSNNQSLLAWSGFQALRLKRVPANVRQQALLIELSVTNNGDPSRPFSIAGTHIVPRTYITGRDPLVAADIQRREDRCRQNGGIGACVILIQCGSISQVMPVEVDPPSKITWDCRDDWADVLTHFVESGRTDFKPISSSQRGVFYGAH